jgi:hypothetical protein
MFQLTVDKQKIELPEVVKSFIEENTTEACRIAKVRSEKRRPASGVNRGSNKTAQEVFPVALKRHGIETSAHRINKVKVVNLHGHEIYNAGRSRVPDTPWVEPGDVPDGRLWELRPDIKKFTVIINSKHPFYAKVFETGNTVLLKYLDCIIVSIAYAELRVRTSESKAIFDEVRDSISEVLRTMANTDGFNRTPKIK